MATKMHHTPIVTPIKTDRFIRTMSNSQKDRYHDTMTSSEKSNDLYDRIMSTGLESFFPTRHGMTPIKKQFDGKSLFRISDPYRVLDAAGTNDDYYLNTVSVSTDDRIAISLRDTCYLCSFDSENVTELYSSVFGASEDLNGLDICGVSFGDKLALGYSNGLVNIIAPDTDKVVDSLKISDYRIPCLIWRDQNTIIFSDRSGLISMSDLRTDEITTMNFFTSEVPDIKVASDMNRMAVGSNQNVMAIWDLRRGFSSDPMIMRPDFKSCVKGLDWCPWDSRMLLMGSGRLDSRIFILNTQTNEYVHTVKTGNQITAARWHSRTKKIVTTCGHNDNSIDFWENDLTNIYKLRLDARILSMYFNSSGSKMVTLSANEKLCLWNIYKGSGQSTSRKHHVTEIGNSLTIR